MILIEPRMRFLSSTFFIRNDKVSTCSVILIEPRMRFLSLTFFVRNDKVSTCSVILDLAENEVFVLNVFL